MDKYRITYTENGEALISKKSYSNIWEAIGAFLTEHYEEYGKVLVPFPHYRTTMDISKDHDKIGCYNVKIYNFNQQYQKYNLYFSIIKEI